MLGQLLFVGATSPVVTWLSRGRMETIIRENHLNLLDIPEQLIIRVPSANSDPTKDALQELHPRVVVVSGTRIIQQHVLKAVQAIFINTYVGITPLYRGVHGGSWDLASHDLANCEVTIQRADKRTDTGDVLAQARISPTKDDTLAGLKSLTFCHS